MIACGGGCLCGKCLRYVLSQVPLHRNICDDCEDVKLWIPFRQAIHLSCILKLMCIEHLYVISTLVAVGPTSRRDCVRATVLLRILCQRYHIITQFH